MRTSLVLNFYGYLPELTGTIFRREGAPAILCQRGKTPGHARAAGTFQWTAAVRALCALYLKSIIHAKDPSCSTTGYITGFHGSAVASLDYALSKQPNWLSDMFGTDMFGNIYARRLILRTNPERKRPGPVILALNDRVIDPLDINLSWDAQDVTTIDNLHALHSLLALNEGLSKSVVSQEAARMRAGYIRSSVETLE